MNRLITTVLLAVAPQFGASILSAAEWADLKVKVLYDGPRPELAPIDGSKEPFCAKLKIPDERMKVGKDGQLVNFAIIMDMQKSEATAIHPDLVNPPQEPLVIESKSCIYTPRVAFVQTGQTVEIVNNDPCGHNFKIDPFNNLFPSGSILPIGGPRKFVFDETERSNFTEFSCTIHPWMKGQLIIRDHPYVGVSNEKGIINIEKLPVGKVTFKLVHENMKKSISKGILDGKKQQWKSGYIELELKPGLNEHTITLSPSLFKE